MIMTDMRRRGTTAMFTGKAGEHAVASQLFLRGMAVTFPEIDLGADLYVHNGCRIQVKSAHVNCTPKSVEKNGVGCYFFPLPKVKRRALTKDRSENVPRARFVEVCDFVVFWGIEENRFWVVPAARCDEVQAFVLGPKNPARFVGKRSDIEEMYRLGYTQTQVAKHYGVSRHAIIQFMQQEGRESQGPSVVSLARECENAWESILNFTSTVPTNSITEEAR